MRDDLPKHINCRCVLLPHPLSEELEALIANVTELLRIQAKKRQIMDRLNTQGYDDEQIEQMYRDSLERGNS